MDANGEAYAIFTYSDAPELMLLGQKLSAALYERGHREASIAVDKLMARWFVEVDATAVVIAGASEGYIIAKIIESAAPNRPPQGDMATHIKSEPGPLGTVAVALIEELDKIINPIGGYGPYWRAQEYGTGNDRVPAQEGRVLYGVFEPSGTRPDARQRGLRVGSDVAFVSDAAATSPGDAGFGTISVELPPRHFLRDGSALAGEKYVERLGDISQRYLNEIGAIVESARGKPTRAAGNVTWAFSG